MAGRIRGGRVKYQEERWADVWGELSLYFQAHFDESGSPGKLDFDYERYHGLGSALQVITARGEALAGYHVSILLTHGLTRDLCAFVDFYYAIRRGRFVGLGLMKKAEEVWRSKGVKTAFSAEKLKIPHAVMYRRRGWVHMENLYSKELK